MMKKDRTIRELLQHLNVDARGWIVVDHWEADRLAIGIASADDPRRLVYVSSFKQPDGFFDYECELPPSGPDDAYTPAGSGTGVSLEQLLVVMGTHLDANLPPKP